MTVIRITEYKNRATVSTLREALEMAERGEIHGVLLAMKYDDKHHGIALTGEYFDDPTDVLAVASRIDFEVNMLVRERKATDRNEGEWPRRGYSSSELGTSATSTT